MRRAPMLEKLMPRSDEFFDDFEAQCKATVEGTKLLHSLLADFNPDELPSKLRTLKEVGARGDEVAHVAFNRLHKQFITPFDRAEIHRLLSRIDDVLDLTLAAAERIRLYEVPTSSPDATELARLLVDSSVKVAEVVSLLRTIKKPEQILAGCKDIKRLEDQGDEVLRSGLARLFKSGADPLTVIKWKEIYDLIEIATDKCLDVAHVVEGVVLEHS
jgi:uncharacterized protein Yka (UPF0111/DUF47 family)